MQNFDTCNKKKQIPLVIPKKIQKKTNIYSWENNRAELSQPQIQPG